MTPAMRRTYVRAASVIVAVLALLPVSASAATPTVTLSVTGHRRSIPDDFFGLSVEVDKLPALAAAGAPVDRMFSILRIQNNQPLMLRLGGRSADAADWVEHPTPVPRWVNLLDNTWMSELSDLVRRDDLRIELTVNLAAHSPSMALAFARAAQNALPPGTLAGLAIGNEPDLYRLQSRLEQNRLASTLRSTPVHWTSHYDADRYVQDFSSYARTLSRGIPGIPLTGPELTFPSLEWPTKLIALRSLRPASLSFHRYATATCTSKQRSAVPNAAAFLDNRFSGGLARTLSGDLRLAAAAQLPLRVSEINSFTCGGRATLASSYATALWAPDALLEMASLGVAAVNWHIRPELANAPFALESHGVLARPEAYGLATFTRMLGPKAELLRVVSDAKPTLALKTWAVSSTHGTKLLVINKGPQPVLTLVHALSSGDASVSRLLAGSPAAQSGETLAGQTIGEDGRWQGQRVISTVPAVRGLYPIRVPAYSAALVAL